MKKFDYKTVGKEIGWCFDKIDIKKESKSKYNYYKEVFNNIDGNAVMLDIGCGGAEKSSCFYKEAKKVVMFDLEEEMIKKAKGNVLKNCGKVKAKKFKFVLGNSRGKLPFKDESFDLVVSRHCGADMNEVFRVLKKGGKFVSEDIASDDCLELKKVFGRGQNFGRGFYEFDVVGDCLKAGFSRVEYGKFEFVEFYKNVLDLEYLLERTPILGGFDACCDETVLMRYVKNFGSKKGIKLFRKLWHLFLVK